MQRFVDPGGVIYGTAGTSGTNILAWWTGPSLNAGLWSVSAGSGSVAGTPCLRLDVASGNTVYLSKTLDAQGVWGGMARLRFTSYPNAGYYHQVLWFADGTTVQLDVRVNPDGTLSVTRNGTVLGTTSFAASPNVYYLVELKAAIHPSAGTVDLWVDGVSKLSLTGQNTRATANSTANVVGIGNVSQQYNAVPGSVTVDYCDVAFYDAQLTDANGFNDVTGPIGNKAVGWSPPSGAGTTTQLTPSTGANYAQLIDASGVDGTSFVDGGAVGLKDTYAMADSPSTASAISGVMAVIYAEKTGPGTRQISPVIRSAGVNTTLLPAFNLSTSFQYYLASIGQNPNGGTPAGWTKANFDGAEMGATVTA